PMPAPARSGTRSRRAPPATPVGRRPPRAPRGIRPLQPRPGAPPTVGTPVRGTGAPSGPAPTARPPRPRSSSPPWALRAGLQRADVIHEVPAIRPAHFVPVDRHQPPAHHLATHDHPVEVAVRASSDRVVDEGAHTEEGPPRRRRDRAVAPARRAVADETVRLIQEPPAVDRLRGARPRKIGRAHV